MPHDVENLRRARQSLEALRAAGIEWVPRVAVPSFVPTSDTYETMPKPKPKPVTPPDKLFEVADQPAVTPDQRRQALSILAETVAKCMKCSELCSTRTQTVFGVGPLDVELCCIGEAPGADEDKQGEPFVGAAGQLLTRILAASGFQRSEVYIANILKCRPPNNRPPKPEESANCREFLHRQLKLVRPKFMVAFGGTAAQNLLATTAPIGKLRGRFHEFRGIPMMVTYHPAYLLPHRAPQKKKEVWEDMQMLVAKMGRSIPEAKKSP